jgi:hypothetical protein
MIAAIRMIFSAIYIFLIVKFTSMIVRKSYEQLAEVDPEISIEPIVLLTPAWAEK